MSFEDFCIKTHDIKKKYDILLLSELLDVYDEYYQSNNKEPLEPIIVFNEIHDSINYSNEESKEVIKQAQKIRIGQN